MRSPSQVFGTLAAGMVVLVLLGTTTLFAQITPAAGYTPPDDTPTIKVGAVIFADYTWTDEPQITDVNGDLVDPAAFNVTRAYINVTGTINHLVSYRITPDITRQTLTGGGALTNNESMVFRLKYAFGQFNLDEAWNSKGSWVRLGAQQTPYLDFVESIYRYRWQGTLPLEREGYISSSDFGLSAHYNFPGNFGDVHGGYYNGESYARAEPNNQKGIQVRATLRPAPMVASLRGLRLTAFYVDDHYAADDPRRRGVFTLTYEHKWVNFGAEHVEATDMPTSTAPRIWSHTTAVWATPRLGKGWELLLRHETTEPNEDVDAHRTRDIGGVAYWFKTTAPNANAALLVDYEHVSNDEVLLRPDETRYALHSLFTF